MWTSLCRISNRVPEDNHSVRDCPLSTCPWIKGSFQYVDDARNWALCVKRKLGLKTWEPSDGRSDWFKEWRCEEDISIRATTPYGKWTQGGLRDHWQTGVPEARKSSVLWKRKGTGASAKSLVKENNCGLWSFRMVIDTKYRSPLQIGWFRGKWQIQRNWTWTSCAFRNTIVNPQVPLWGIRYNVLDIDGVKR